MLDHAALAFVVTRQGGKHRQAGGIARGPAGRTQRIAPEVELRAVGCLPARADQFGLPHFPQRPAAGLDDDRVAVAAVVIDVLLPLLEGEAAGAASARSRWACCRGSDTDSGRIRPHSRRKRIGTGGCEFGTSTKFISWNARRVRRLASRSAMICAIMASEFGNKGRREMSSFQALVTGKICIAETMASAWAVLKRTALVTTGAGPRIRPS